MEYRIESFKGLHLLYKYDDNGKKIECVKMAWWDKDKAELAELKRKLESE